jgi:thioredoxin-related protein
MGSAGPKSARSLIRRESQLAAASIGEPGAHLHFLPVLACNRKPVFTLPNMAGQFLPVIIAPKSIGSWIMKRILFVLVLTSMLSIVSGMALADESPIKWHTNVHSALKAARASHRPVIMFVTAKWCQFCHKMENDTFTNPAIARKMQNGFVPLWIDADEHPELVEKFKVDMFPAMLFFGADGKFRERAGGYMPVEEAGQLLDEASR